MHKNMNIGTNSNYAGALERGHDTRMFLTAWKRFPDLVDGCLDLKGGRGRDAGVFRFHRMYHGPLTVIVDGNDYDSSYTMGVKASIEDCFGKRIVDGSVVTTRVIDEYSRPIDLFGSRGSRAVESRFTNDARATTTIARVDQPDGDILYMVKHDDTTGTGESYWVSFQKSGNGEAVNAVELTYDAQLGEFLVLTEKKITTIEEYLHSYCMGSWAGDLRNSASYVFAGAYDALRKPAIVAKINKGVGEVSVAMIQ